uniref:Ser/thr-rich glycoprotein ORF-Q n=1 Tax=Elephant endotheliotropic herpesvirus 1A TaxID=759753 RepID=U6BWW4_ELHV1|nr:ser/thr-rich glycoprotein ORF-Q [Elephant endotheliotropic herpesvirus 1A]
MLFTIALLLYASTYCNANTTSNYSNYLLAYKLLPPRPYEYAFLISTPLINCSKPPQTENMMNVSVWTTQNNYTVIATNNKTDTVSSYNITYVKIPKNKTNGGPSNIFTVNNENVSKDFTSNLFVENYTSIDNINITGNHTFIIYGLPNITEKYNYCIKNKTRLLRIDEIPSVCRKNDTKNGTFYMGIFDYSSFPANSSTIEQHLISNYGIKGHRNCSIRQFIRNYLYNNISDESSICSLNNTLSDNVMSTLSSTFSQSTYSSGFRSTLTYSSTKPSSVSMQTVSTSSVAITTGLTTSHSSVTTTLLPPTSSEGVLSKPTGNRYV